MIAGEDAACLALDIGNVCLHIRPERCLAKLNFAAATEIPPRFMEAIDLYERGLFNESEWLEVFRELTNGVWTDDELRCAYNLILAEELDGVFDLLHELSMNGIRLIFFSDTSEIHLREVFSRFRISSLVSGGIYSFEIGAKKPEAPMYEAFESFFGKPLLYLDDKEENIAAGVERGWPSHLFRGADGLRIRLREFIFCRTEKDK